jgi:hypothetical protein
VQLNSMYGGALAYSTTRQALRLELVASGLGTGASMLNVAPIDLSHIRYRVPAPPHVARLPDGSSWLKWTDAAHVDTLSPPGGSFLVEFMRLDTAPEDRIQQFAALRGPIHDVGWEILGDIGDGAGSTSWRFTEQLRAGGIREPIKGWQGKARQLRALLRAAAALQRGDAPASDDIQNMLYGGHIAQHGTRRFGARVIAPNGAERDLGRVGSGAAENWRLISLIAAEWAPVEDLHIGPEVDRETGSIRVAVQMTRPRQPLVAMLGLELMAALSSPVGIWSCQACSYPYMPARVPRADRKRFCPTCSEGRAAARMWWRQHRSKRGKVSQPDG